VMYGGNSPHSFGGWPCNLTGQLAWTWEPPLGKYSATGVFSPVVDEALNLYVVTEDSIRKFSPSGAPQWTFRAPPKWRGTFGPWFRKGPALLDGLLLTSLSNGFAFALSMETGQLVWNVSVSVTGQIGMDYGWVVAGEGVVIGDSELSDPPKGVNNKVWALNASDGSHLWDFHPEVGVWNFIPIFLDDGTVIFQTWDGGVYRLQLRDGKVLWHVRGGGNTWTDGGPAAGPNGAFYAVRSTGGQEVAASGAPGFLDAYRIADGTLLWSRSLEQTPYTYPVVGRLREGAKLSVVTGVGSLGMFPAKIVASIAAVAGGGLGLLVGFVWAIAGLWRKKGSGSRLKLCCCRLLMAAVLGVVAVVCLALALTKREFRHSVQAFDAETGELQWRYDMPPWKWYSASGDEEGLLTRVMHGRVPVCLPLASSYPTLDAQGIFYMGHMDGRLYAIQDRDGDGRIEDESEVCTYDAGGSFSVPGPTLVPGLMAVGTCDSLFVFRQ